jgi:hypothetical protein
MTQQLEETIRRAQGGDRNAFSCLVEQHYAVMCRFACRYCGDRQDAEDVTQQACVKLARSIGQFRMLREARFATAVAGFAQLLEGSKYVGHWHYSDALTLAQSNRGDDTFGYRAEFIQLIRKAEVADAM